MKNENNELKISIKNGLGKSSKVDDQIHLLEIMYNNLKGLAIIVQHYFKVEHDESLALMFKQTREKEYQGLLDLYSHFYKWALFLPG